MADEMQEKSDWITVDYTGMEKYMGQALKMRARDPDPDKQFNVLVVGGPGIGKTHAAIRAAKTAGRPIRIFALPIMKVEDINVTIPIGEDSMKQLVNDQLKNIEPHSVLFLDEFTLAEEGVRNGIMQLLNEGRVGSFRLPEDVTIFACCNRESDINTVPLRSPEAGRFYFKMNLEPTEEEFIEHNNTLRWGSLTNGYIKIDPSARTMYNPSTNMSLMSPRQWAKLAEFETLEELLEFCPAVLPSVLSHKFVSYVKNVKMYEDLDKYLDGSKELPSDYAAKVAIAAAIAIQMERANTTKKLDDSMNKILEQKIKGANEELLTFIMVSSLKTYMRLKKYKEPADIILGMKDVTIRGKMITTLKKFTAYAD